VNTLPRAAGAALAIVLTLALGWASDAPMPAFRPTDAVVRVSWGARPERIETCRTQSDEELAKLMPQMRQRVVCEGTTARYRLEVRHDGRLLASQEVRGGGLRHDRELYVFRELRVPPGPSSLDVRFVRLDSVPAEREDARERGPGADSASGGISPERVRRETEERRRRREEAVPASLALRSDVTLRPREVLLVTYDAEARRLVAVRRTP